MPHHRTRRPSVVALAVAAFVLLAACRGDAEGRAPVDGAAAVPEVGACRVLDAEDVAEESDGTAAVACTEPHTAETFAVGDLPAKFDDAAYDARELGGWAYRTCSAAFQDYLGADESLVMRTIVTWAWFRPSEAAWDDGARWYRCDIVGGGEQSAAYVTLPTSARGLLTGPPDNTWMVCVNGDSVTQSPRISCAEEHTWRAVTTIKLGEKADAYPGDRLVEVNSRDFCSRSVGAWLNYPDEYEFSYTWFHQAEWDAGNRRSVCWARTAQ